MAALLDNLFLVFIVLVVLPAYLHILSRAIVSGKYAALVSATRRYRLDSNEREEPSDGETR